VSAIAIYWAIGASLVVIALIVYFFILKSNDPLDYVCAFSFFAWPLWAVTLPVILTVVVSEWLATLRKIDHEPK
jgi:hypothetical protein